MPKQNGSSSRIVHDQEYSFRSPSGDDQTEQEGRKDPDKMNGGPVLFRHFVTPLLLPAVLHAMLLSRMAGCSAKLLFFRSCNKVNYEPHYATLPLRSQNEQNYNIPPPRLYFLHCCYIVW